MNSTGYNDTLGPSFSALTLNSPSSRSNEKPEGEDPTKAQVIRLEPREMPFFRISPTPAAAATSPRYYFYGWPVHFEPFIELAKKSGYRPRELAAEYTMVDAVMYIRRESGYKYAHATVGVVDSECEEYALPEAAPYAGEKMMYMITIFTNSKMLRDHIPTGPQMLKLAKIFDYRVPKWYKDARPRSDFELYCWP